MPRASLTQPEMPRASNGGAGREALVLLSGGLDSAAVLLLLQAEGWACETLFVDYGQLARTAEHKAATLIATKAGVKLADATVGGLEVGAGEIPGRNSLLASLAFTVSAGRHDGIALGIHAGTPYWDCSPAFVEVTQRTFDAQADGAVRLLAPLLELDKLETGRLARHLGVPMERTWSCEAGSEEPCGACLSCRDRAAVVADAAVR